MKLNHFCKIYFVLYSALFFFQLVFFQIRFDKIGDFGLEALLCYLFLPVISFILSKLFVFVAPVFGKKKIELSEIGGVKNKGFSQIFFVTSFFIPFVFLGLMFIFYSIVNLWSFSDPIYILSLEMLVVYLIIILFSFLFSRFARKLDNDISSLYKNYLIVFPIILLILILGLYAYQHFVEHNHTNYRFDRCIIFALPLVTTLLSFIIGCIIALKKNKRVDSTVVTTKLDSFGKLFFIASLITTFCNTFLFLCFIDRSSFNFEYLSELFNYFFITSFILTIFIAFAIKPIINYWKTSKITSILLAIIYAKILFDIFYLGNTILDERVFNGYVYEHYNYNYDEAMISEVAVQEIAPYREEHEVEEVAVEAEEKAPFYLSFLWNDPEDDQINVTEALIETKKNRAFHTIKWLWLGIPDRQEKPLYKIVRYIRENRESIDFSNLLNTYSSLTTSVIPKSVYEENQYGLILRLLCDSYYDLSDYDENQEMHKMKAIYEIMYHSRGDYRNNFELIKPYISKYYRKKYDYFETDFEYFDNYEELVWAYSFWGRRYKEGNIEQAINLIHEIRSLYNDYEEEY